MKRRGDMYTIVVFRGPTTTPLRVSLPRALVRGVLVLGVCLVLAELIFVSEYVSRTGEVWELNAIRAEIQGARQQMIGFAAAVDDLKRRLLAMKEVNQQLRVMLGLQGPKPEDMFNGKGGEEIPMAEDDSRLSVASPEQQEQVSPNQGSEPGSTTERSHDQSLAPPDDKQLQSRVRRELDWLQTEASFQERSLEELTMAAKERSARWAATPSIWPVKGWITSGFGPRISPFTGKPAMHAGLDIGAPPNAPVQAPATGRVVALTYDERMGKVIRLDHGYGIETLYGHLGKALVKNGQRVKRGDRIGLVGNTGLFSTGPHLHYQVLVKSQAVNPQRYILD